MEHITQHDWCSSKPDRHFVLEADVDNSATERILRNKFHDPLISSESEDDRKPREVINWNEIFKKKRNDKVPHTTVPGLLPVPQYLKLSALNGQQHYQMLKVLCSQNPDILPGEFIGRPTKQDFRVFEMLKQTYENEQKEFIDWAKIMWTSNHCVRALRPKPPIELVYDAEFKVMAHRLESFPKNYILAAQIPLDSANVNCEMVLEKVLIKVNHSTLPQIEVPDMSNRVYILKPYPTPEPCSKHPCRFILPNESSMTVLPLTEVQRELAQYGADCGAQFVASEEALRSLVELDRPWLLALSVCSVISIDGERTSVVVLDSEFSLQRPPARVRTRLAYSRLLARALLPQSEIKRTSKKSDPVPKTKHSTTGFGTMDLSDEDDDDNLYIDLDDLPNTTEEHDAMETESIREKDKSDSIKEKDKGDKEKPPDAHNTTLDNKIDFFSCTCRETLDKPPQRSYKKWRLVNKTTNDKYSIIIHSPHIAKGGSGEVLLYAWPEYQLELGASDAGADARRAHALALMLRKNASILNVRIDGTTGEIVTTEAVYHDDFMHEHAGVAADVRRRLHTALDQLQGLLPGHYVLRHEPSHGDNAILYRPGGGGGAGPGGLSLRAEAARAGEADEAAAVRAPPTITTALLPVHKYRRQLPCAFTPHASQLPRAPRRAPARCRTPPQALKWPKRKGKKKKNNQNNNN